MSALSSPQLGEYLGRHCIASFMKVGTFQVIAGQKQGGNVASYFCTPDGQVLHIVAGPVSAAVLLREARWVIDTRKLARLKKEDGRRLRDVFRRAHRERLRREPGGQTPLAYPVVTAGDVADMLHTPGLSAQGRVHLLLSTAPLVPLDKVYRAVFEELLNETVSTLPVVETAAASAVDIRSAVEQEEARRARRSPPLAEIHSGQSLNALLVDLQLLDERGVTLPATALPEGMQDRLQVSVGGQSNRAGLLARRTIPWPALLRLQEFDEVRQDLEERLRRLSRPEDGRLPGVDALRRLSADLRGLEQRLTRRLRDLPVDTCWDRQETIVACRFLEDLRKTVQALGQADALLYGNGSYSAQGKTVAELVRHMTTHGLRFAPALPGEEAAYLALHRLLSAADVQARASLE